jgi:hypothetical protein
MSHRLPRFFPCRPRSEILPFNVWYYSDFFIGAHAAVFGIPVLTRDTHHYRACFPAGRLVAPAPRPPAG